MIKIKMQYTTRKDLQDLLELLNTTNEIEVQAKIFSLFCCYLVSGNSTHADLIITSHFVFDKIYGMLMNGLPKKVTVTLNFVTALLFETEEEACTTKQSLVLHARNMLRVSGCLALMSNLYNGCMVHQETWTALCRCLSEVCKYSKENQNYCADLIPTGIRRCATGDMESYQVLQSLLQRHDGNTQQYIESNGLTIFTRDKLHKSSCLKLVNAVAQNPKAVILLVHSTEVVEILRNFLSLYGKDSQIGQWATIILYHIKSFIKDLEEQPKEKIIKANYGFCVNENSSNNKTRHGETTKLFQSVFREILHGQQHDGNLYDMGRRERARSTADKKIHNMNSFKSHVNTFPSEKMRTNRSKLAHQPGPIITPNTNNCGIVPKSTRGELSFSFLREENFNRYPYRNSRNQQLFSTASVKSESTLYVSKTSAELKQNNEHSGSYYNKTQLDENMEDCTADRTIEFKPTIVSTPKRLTHKQRRLHNSSITLKKEERRISRDTFKHRKTAIKEAKNMSFGGKIFSAINDSCTMIVKTVKNIFITTNPDDNIGIKKDKSSTEIKSTSKPPHSNYSFMEYMRRRDAIMGSQWGDLSAEKKSGSSCATCNDTVLLKRKLEKDQNLKQTIKKLKLGINLYGCDFKKISAMMWPRDSYMTPTVLYNLYRKLIVK